MAAPAFVFPPSLLPNSVSVACLTGTVAGQRDKILDNRDTDMDRCDALTAEMQGIVRGAAEPWAPGDGVKAGIGRAARRLGLRYRRARSFWYGERAAVRALEADALRTRNRELLAERRRRITAEAARLDALLGSDAAR